MKIRLSKKDIELLSFLKKYQIMEATYSKRIYKSKDYYYKRLKLLEKEKYIKRVNYYYIKLDIVGSRLMTYIGYDNNPVCRNEDYLQRVKEISKIATLTLDSDIEFISSWELKDKGIYTDKGRKFIGSLKYQEKNYITYYISKDKERLYISQTKNDIEKTTKYKNAIIFMENFKNLNKNNRYFIFGKNSTLIINHNKKNFDRMRLLEKIDIIDILRKIYNEKEILLSSWDKADYMLNKRKYIFLMPFIDTEKLHKLNVYYNNNKTIDRKIDILTFKDNKEKIDEILTNRTNIIELDSWLGGIDVEVEI